ncbi:MAG: hypothetical protein ACLVI9_05025 [Anaerostipes hadrus]
MIVHKDYQILNFKAGISRTDKTEDVWEVVKQAEKALQSAQEKQINNLCYEDLTEEQKIIPEDMKIDERPPFEKLKEMSLSSLALNLFDRSGDMKVTLDMLALKLQEVCGLYNIVITTFNKEYLVNSLFINGKTKINFKILELYIVMQRNICSLSRQTSNKKFFQSHIKRDRNLSLRSL